MWWGLECYDNAFVSFKYVCIDLGGTVLWVRRTRRTIRRTKRTTRRTTRRGQEDQEEDQEDDQEDQEDDPRGPVLFVLININGRDK